LGEASPLQQIYWKFARTSKLCGRHTARTILASRVDLTFPNSALIHYASSTLHSLQAEARALTLPRRRKIMPAMRLLIVLLGVAVATVCLPQGTGQAFADPPQSKLP